VTTFEGAILREQGIGTLDNSENAAGQASGLYSEAIFEWNRKEDNLPRFIGQFFTTFTNYFLCLLCIVRKHSAMKL
jgi:hypothetical protein